MTTPILGVFGLGGGEILIILAVLAFLGVVLVTALVLGFLIIRSFQKKRSVEPQPAARP